MKILPYQTNTKLMSFLSSDQCSSSKFLLICPCRKEQTDYQEISDKNEQDPLYIRQYVEYRIDPFSYVQENYVRPNCIGNSEEGYGEKSLAFLGDGDFGYQRFR